MNLTRIGIVVVSIAIVAVVAMPYLHRGVDQQKFDGIYRASKAIQSATTSGVSYARFVELRQGLATELAIAKDRSLTDNEKALLQLYTEAFFDYDVSASLWRAKLEASDSMWRGEIPIWLDGSGIDPSIGEESIARYGYPVFDRTLSTGKKYKAVPSTAIPVVWQHADHVLEQASAIFNGKQ